MSNEFYDPPELLAPGVKARSADINQINQRLATAFDKLPGELAVKGGFVNYGANTSAVNDVYAVTLAPKIIAYVDGLEVKLRPVKDNTGACTLNVNGLGNIAIKRTDGSNPQAGDIQANATIYLSYSAALNAFILPPVVNSQLTIATAAAAAAAISRDEAAAWATSLAVVSTGLYGARKYANDAAAAANAAAAWATSLASVDGTYFGARKYAQDAAAAAALAQDWASKMNGVVSGGLYSAQYWAGQAQAYAQQTANGQVQADWNEASNVSKAFIWNKPDIPAMIAASTPAQVLGNYVNNGLEKPNYFSGGRMRLNMLQGNGANLPAGTPTWSDVLWLSSYAGNDVKGSNALILGKTGTFIGFARQDYDSGAWGAVNQIWHSGNMNPPAVGAVANSTVQRDANGYLQGSYINMTDDVDLPTAVSGIIVKKGDNYYRTGSAGAVRNFLAYTGAHIATSTADYTRDVGIAQNLRWKNYGNGHIIIDASAGTSPTGSAISKNNADVAWTAGYPMLVGWNGSQTFGMRVDSARVADSTTYAVNATRLYASAAPYSYGNSNPYFMTMDFDGTRWRLSVSPSTPGTVSVAHADAANSATTAADAYHLYGRGNYAWPFAWAADQYGYGMEMSFGGASETGHPHYCGILHFRPYTAGVGGSLQLFTPYGPSFGGTTLKYRVANNNDGTWSSVIDIISSANIGSYTAGNANTLGGFSPAYSDLANTVPVRDASGRLSANSFIGYVFTPSPNDNFVFEGYDTAHYGLNIKGYTSMAASGNGVVLSGYAGIVFTTGALERMRIRGDGEVLISKNLTVSGNITAYSDETLKINWRPVADDFVAKWAQVKSGIYDRIDTKLTQPGLSAQSVQKILPEAVTDDGERLALNYLGAVGVASVEAAKEIVALRQIVADLIKRIETLESK